MVIKANRKKKKGGAIAKRAQLSMIGKEKAPVRRCDTCAYSKACTFSKDGYECAFQEVFDNINISSMDDVEKAQKELVGMLVERAAFSFMMERMEGVISDEAASSAEIALKYLSDLRSKSNSGGAYNGPSILAQIFQTTGPLPTDERAQEVISVEYEAVENEDEKKG